MEEYHYTSQKVMTQKKMGIEHTHPPMEYIFLGNRNHFQKLKKRYWLDEQQS